MQRIEIGPFVIDYNGSDGIAITTPGAIQTNVFYCDDKSKPKERKVLLTQPFTPTTKDQFAIQIYSWDYME